MAKADRWDTSRTACGNVLRLLLSGSSWHTYCRCTNLLTVCNQATILGLRKSLMGTVEACTAHVRLETRTIVCQDLELHQKLPAMQRRPPTTGARQIDMLTIEGYNCFAISARGLYRRHSDQLVESRSTSWNPADEYSCAHKTRSVLQLLWCHPPQTGCS